MPGTVNNAQIDTLANMKIDIVAHAIQVDGFEADPASNKTAEDVAWDAFDKQLEEASQNP